MDLWIDTLEQHLAGSGPKPELPLHLTGSAFQLTVWRFLSSFKAGETLSYADVTKSIAKPPAAYCAVANACGANNIAVLIPCHRMLRGNGTPDGYRRGVARKQHDAIFHYIAAGCSYQRVDSNLSFHFRKQEENKAFLQPATDAKIATLLLWTASYD